MDNAQTYNDRERWERPTPYILAPLTLSQRDAIARRLAQWTAAPDVDVSG